MPHIRNTVQDALDEIREGEMNTPLPEQIRTAPQTVQQTIKEQRAIVRKEQKSNSMIKKKFIQQRFVQMYTCGFYSTRQIADTFRISKSTVGKWLKDPDVQEMITAYQVEEKAVVDTMLNSLKVRAVESISDLLDSDNPIAKLNAATDILDRTGHAAKKQQDVNVNISYEQRLESLVNSSTIIDASYEQVDAINGEENKSKLGDVNGE